MNINLEFANPVEWNIENDYAINDVVFYGTDAFTALDYVPAGIALTNTTYWKKTGKYIRTSNIADIAVTTQKLANKSVTTQKLADGAITKEILPDVITSSASGESVTAADASYLASLTVDGKAVQDGTPTPSAPVPVQVVDSVNLWDEQWENGGYNNSTGAPTASSSYIRTKNAIRVTPNTEYYFKHNTGVYLYLYFYDGAGTFLSYINLGSSGTTFTTPSGAYMLRFCDTSDSSYDPATKPLCVNVSDSRFNGNYYPHGLCLQVGSTVTSIDLNGNVLASLPDGTKDILTVDSVGHVVMEKRVGVVNLGNESWTRDTTGAFYALEPLKKYGSLVIMCSVYQTLPSSFSFSSYSSYPDGLIAGNEGGTNQYFYVKDTRYTTAADLKASLSGVLVYFALKTPQTIDLGYIDMPAIPDGSTISITAQVTPTISASWWNENASDIPNAVSAISQKIDSSDKAIINSIDVLESSIAYVEETNFASKNYAQLTFFIKDNQLYKTTTAITSGEEFVEGTNIAKTTIIDAIQIIIESMI